MAESFNILPGIGIGELLFGSTRDEARKALGDPTAVAESEDGEGEIWLFEKFATAISFAPFEELRFVSCETFHPRALIAGETFIGLPRAEVEAALARMQIDDFEVEGEQIRIGTLALHFWLSDGAVESIGWGVLVTPEGEVLWPERDS